MGRDVGDLIVLIVVGVVVAISALAKSLRAREAKAREERMRQLRHRQPFQDPIGTAATPPPKPAGPSPLQQFRQFMEQVQAQSGMGQARTGQGQARTGEGQAQTGRGRMEAPPAFEPQHPLRHAAPEARPPQATPARPKQQAAARPGRGMLTEHMDEKEASAPGVVAAPHEKVSPLEVIFASERSDFEKAILLSEIMGKPVALRRPVPPRQRS